jgi:hypothetical protein
MVGRSFWIKRCSVDEFKRPCPDVEIDIITFQLSSTLNDTAESDMRKRAPHVCVDLDDVHTSKCTFTIDLRFPQFVGSSPLQ